MREPIAPTLDELLAELTDISKASPGGKTVTEWCEFWRVNPTRGRALVHHAIKTGRMTTAMTYRADVGRPGRRVQIWLHSFVSKVKPKAKAKR